MVVPHPVIDLCSTCQNNNSAIVSVGARKKNHRYIHVMYTYVHTLALKTGEEHILRATCERSLYHSVVEESTESIHGHF